MNKDTQRTILAGHYVEGDVGKRSLHPLIGGAVAPQHGSLVLLGDVHHVLDRSDLSG